MAAGSLLALGSRNIWALQSAGAPSSSEGQDCLGAMRVPARGSEACTRPFADPQRVELRPPRTDPAGVDSCLKVQVTGAAKQNRLRDRCAARPLDVPVRRRVPFTRLSHDAGRDAVCRLCGASSIRRLERDPSATSGAARGPLTSRRRTLRRPPGPGAVSVTVSPGYSAELGDLTPR